VRADPASARIAILTRANDFHAYAIRHTLEERGVGCAIVETDTLAGSGGMSWSLSGEVRAVLPEIEGGKVEVADLDLIWWRRLTGEPRLPERLEDEAARDLVASDCRATLGGLALTEFRGRWVSHPESTRLAENKLIQLAVARSVGLRLPRTLVSQDPEAVRRFCRDQDHRVVVKTVAGSRLTPVMAGRVTPELLASAAEIELSPAIYQTLIPGSEHLRICCFGDETYTALLRTERLDWRYPLDAAAERFELEASISDRLREMLKRLDLRMGVFDMKLDPEGGEPFWLEVNPQGQFLFLQGMCELPLTEVFTDFLVRELERPPGEDGRERLGLAGPVAATGVASQMLGLR
jgi:glutathione synthase/RimK-type ligase-like ATP-grasp enzyme